MLQLFAAAAPVAVACLASQKMAGPAASVLQLGVLPSTVALSSMVRFLKQHAELVLEAQAALAPSMLLPWLQEALLAIQSIADSGTREPPIVRAR